MAIVRFIAGAGSCSIAAALTSIVGCSGNSDSSIFNGTPDSGEAPQPVYDAGNFFPDDPGGDAGGPVSCAPIGSGTFTPQWKPPAPFAQGACSTAQMDGFYNACL